MASYIYRTRLFRPEEGLGPQEPEIRPDSVGVALSGGGSRSLVASTGQLRGLRHLGVMDRVWGISAASGGSWAAVPYVYLPSKFCEDAFLGAVVQDPGELTWFRHRGKPRETALDFLPQHNLCAVAQHLGVLAMLEEAKKLIGRGFLPDETWSMAVGRKVLHPFGLFDPDARGFQRRSFTWSEASYREDVEWLNKPCDKPRDGDPLARGKFRTVERDGRPFVIVNTAIVPWRGEPDLLPFEITPLAAGLPGWHPEVGPGDRDLGGGWISPFAIGSTRAIAENDDTARATRPVHPFSLADMIGVSSVAPAEELQTRVPELDAMIPRAMLWPVRGFWLPRNSAWPYLFTDGGSLEGGRSQEIELYEVLDGLPDRALREASRADFEAAVEHLVRGAFDTAATAFTEIHRRNPADRAARFQLEKAQRLQRA